MKYTLSTLIKIFSSQKMRFAILAIFALQAVVLAVIMPFGTPPDEQNNIEFIRFYEHNSPSPIFSEQTPTWSLGDKTREVDYLYHYAMSWVTRFMQLPGDGELYVVRFISVAAAVVSFLAFAYVWRKLGIKNGAINTALLVLMNLPMVLMLGGAINNDVYVWLALGLSSVLVVRLMERARVFEVLLLANLVIYAGLVKRTFLPLALVFGLFLVYIIIKNRQKLLPQWNNQDWRLWISAIVLMAGVGLFTERIGGNIVRYGSVQVECEAVHGKKACDVFWANDRAKKLAAQPKAPIKSFTEFVPTWFMDSFKNIADIQTQGWRHEVVPPGWYTGLMIAILGSGLAYGVAHDIKKHNTKQARWRLAAVAIGAYIFVYQLAVNYRIYQDTQVFGVALNGRYVLPGVILLAGLCAYYWTKILKKSKMIQVSIAAAVIVVTILFTGLFMTLRNPQIFGH